MASKEKEADGLTNADGTHRHMAHEKPVTAIISVAPKTFEIRLH